MKNRKPANLLLIILSVAEVVLTAVPGFVRMRFAAPDPEPAYIEYCSGFSMLPVGYGNWGPMLAGVFSCITVVLAVIHWFRSTERAENWMLGLSAAGAGILTATSLLFGTGTVFSWIVAALLVIEALIVYQMKE